jgi:outer membrane biosynthesis protein TonB
MDGRLIVRRARVVVASLATLLLLVGASAAVVTHEEPESAPSDDEAPVARAAVVGLAGASAELHFDDVEPAPAPSAAIVAEPTTTTTAPPPEPTTTTTAPPPEPTTTTTAPPPPPTTTTTAPPPPPTTTTAPPTTTTTEAVVASTDPTGSNFLSEAQVRSLVERYFPASEVDKAVLVAQCESNFDANARGGSGDNYVGLFQHADWVWADRAAKAGFAGADWWNPEANVAVSAWLLNGDDWWHWSNCSSKADAQLGG